MNFFFDHCISPRLAAMVAVLKQEVHEIRHLTQDPRFERDTEDREWMKTLARDESPWIVISGDADIVDTPQERALLIASRLTFFCMDKHWMRTRIDDQAWKLLKIWPEIERHARNPEPTLHRIRTGPGNRLDIEIIGQGGRARGGRFRGQIDG